MLVPCVQPERVAFIGFHGGVSAGAGQFAFMGHRSACVLPRETTAIAHSSATAQKYRLIMGFSFEK